MKTNEFPQPEQGAENPAPRTTAPELDDPRVIQALEEYLEAVEAGQRPNRQAFLARHAIIAGALAGCLDGMEALRVADSSSHPFSRESSAGVPGVGWQPGIPLGDFRVIREIGRGGMGVVYEAEQLSLGRRIALKVLPLAFTLDARQLQRFKNEARAAAQLHHSNIVPVYSVGCERGVHFYAMQYIEGQTLAEVIQELRQVAGRDKGAVFPVGMTRGGDPTGPAGTPPAEVAVDTAIQPVGTLATAYSTDSPAFFRAVARLGVQAAEALEHAHAYGVVHRDVKPGNLLVDAAGQLWITDFGLALFQNDAALTRTGDLLGTLRYMSPEQALARRGLVDHRTDIYSLGATLYELMTHEPVYDGRDREELLRQIAFEEPRLPRRWNPDIPADLETILLKALAKGVEERYPSAQDLADDLRRYLDNRPILARRPTLRERAAKWARRHKAMVGAAVLLLVLLAVGFGLSTALVAGEQWKTRMAYEQLAEEQARTQKALDRERQRAQEARAERARAEKSFQQAREAVDFLTQVSEKELANDPRLVDLRRQLLEAALVYYQSFVDDRQNDRSAQKELAAARERVANILGELSASQGLGRLMFLALILRERPVQEDLLLSEDQEEKAHQLGERLFKESASFNAFRQLTPEGRRKNVQEMTRSADKSLGEILTPGQAKRLKQIALQKRGADALTDPEVVATLELTASQKQTIRTIQAEARQAMTGPPPGPPLRGRKGPEKGRKGPDQGRKDFQGRLVSVLTPEQKAQWAEMIGGPFKGEICPAPKGKFGPKNDSRHHGRR